jgi:hypothetical protein
MRFVCAFREIVRHTGPGEKITEKLILCVSIHSSKQVTVVGLINFRIGDVVMTWEDERERLFVTHKKCVCVCEIRLGLILTYKVSGYIVHVCVSLRVINSTSLLQKLRSLCALTGLLIAYLLNIDSSCNL